MTRFILDERAARTLAQAVIIQAARDAAGGDTSAAAWLRSSETADTWGTLAGVNWLAVISWADAGCKLRGVTNKNKSKAARMPIAQAEFI